jgi:citrate lyase subunit beta/citryl-CoA lyase
LIVLRSVLFVPGTRPDRFPKALASGADAVVFDLEDSVEPGRKAEARDVVAQALDTLVDDREVRRFVRVNAASSEWIDDDLAAIRRMARVDAVVLPKAESSSDVERVAGALASRAVVPILESAAGVLNSQAIAHANAEILALLFGAEDLTAQLGIARTIDGEEILAARSLAVLAAASAGTEPVDAVFIDLKNPDGLRRDALRARALGFRGKMAVHPNQVPVINEVFSPSADELADARGIVEAYDAATTRGDGVIRYQGLMVDVPIVMRARRVIARAAAIQAQSLQRP